jgi:hypothetical protein
MYQTAVATDTRTAVRMHLSSDPVHRINIGNSKCCFLCEDTNPVRGASPQNNFTT